jgi:hypothetical protein
MSAQNFVVEILAIFGGSAASLLALILADKLKTGLKSGLRASHHAGNAGGVELDRHTAAA